MFQAGESVCHALTGEVGVVKEVGTGKFKDWVRVRWDLSGKLYFHKPAFIGDVSRAAEIRKAHRKNKPLPDDREDNL
jgi:hypothetical protein